MSPRVSVRLLSTQSDERLLEFVAAGHERAFEALVLRYRRPLLAYCARLGLADARAEDAVQQSLLKAWLAVREGSVVNDARPWLYRIAHNTAVSALRAAPAERFGELEPGRLVAVGAECEPERRIAARAALADVAALPDMQRNVILMSAVAGHSHDEVASALGITSGAVRGLLYRARAALRSAAAALTPQPLIAWAAGGGGAGSSTAGRLVEISAAGGGDLGPALAKGAALGLTAALAAGAVLVPVHAHPHSHPAQGSGHAHHATSSARDAAALGAAGTELATSHAAAGGAAQSARGSRSGPGSRSGRSHDGGRTANGGSGRGGEQGGSSGEQRADRHDLTGSAIGGDGAERRTDAVVPSGIDGRGRDGGGDRGGASTAGSGGGSGGSPAATGGDGSPGDGSGLTSGSSGPVSGGQPLPGSALDSGRDGGQGGTGDGGFQAPTQPAPTLAAGD